SRASSNQASFNQASPLWHNNNIKGNYFDWIQSFLSNRSQQVIVDASKSNVALCEPQGNHTPKCISLKTRLLPDDCIIFRQKLNLQDCGLLPDSLNNLTFWEKKRDMGFHQNN
ncbi:LOW QUALITY PROTEIN: hypothetical protein MAR_037902, partial [Mya arenaria]